jgi:hypothetical protein
MFRFAQHDKNGYSNELARLPHRGENANCEFVTSYGVANWICDSGFVKAFEPQETGIAFAARDTFGRRVVTTVGKRKIDAELDGFANDFSFRQLDQGRMNLKPSALNPGFCSKVGQGFERFDEFRAAIGVAAIIDRIDAEKNVIGWDYFGPGKRISEENRVACGHVSDWNAAPDLFFRPLLRHI